jgi:hypothetical protein
VKRGRIPLLPDGTIDAEQADAAWPRRGEAAQPAPAPTTVVGFDPRALERVLSWIAPWWAARRAAARRARYQHAAWKQITAAHDAPSRDREHIPSRYGPAWRGSRWWQR